MERLITLHNKKALGFDINGVGVEPNVLLSSVKQLIIYDPLIF